MKKIIFLIGLTAMLFAGCSPQAETAPTAIETAPPVMPTQAAETAAPTAFIPTSAPASCVAQTGVFPTPDPTLQATFPPSAEGDWVLGESTAKLTIIEYSDFQ
ncbi:MAG: hypothetical protein IT308_03025 [Anaerolineaceae bacterium]|nr:hypothetical protein [Anaerolineaceae bacterium]